MGVTHGRYAGDHVDDDDVWHVAARQPPPESRGWVDGRHTYSGGGRQLAQRGVSLYKIATLMGNSPEICRRHYAAIIPDAMTDDVEFSTRLPLRLTAAGA